MLLFTTIFTVVFGGSGDLMCDAMCDESHTYVFTKTGFLFVSGPLTDQNGNEDTFQLFFNGSEEVAMTEIDSVLTRTQTTCWRSDRIAS